MPYEIPQKLQYEEKIIFNLTFKQLIYALIFGTITLTILFKLNYNFYIKGVLALIPAFLGILFMFFNFASFLKDYFNFLRFRKIKKNDPRLRKFLNIKEIKDNLIITLNKNQIAVLKVTPINFKIKTLAEKETILLNFQKFLNSLEFPIQVIVNTVNLNLDSYLNKIKDNIKYKEQFNDYKKHLENTITSNNILNRNFYIIIKENNDLDIKIQICKERLELINLKVRSLENKELISLLENYYDKEIKLIYNYSDYIKINNRFNRIITAYGYPRLVEAGFLDKIISLKGNFDLSLYIIPNSIETTLVNLNKELQKQRADLYSLQQKGILNPSLEIQYNDTRKILEELQKGKDKLFNISLYINCKANALRELQENMFMVIVNNGKIEDDKSIDYVKAGSLRYEIS